MEFLILLAIPALILFALAVRALVNDARCRRSIVAGIRARGPMRVGHAIAERRYGTTIPLDGKVREWNSETGELRVIDTPPGWDEPRELQVATNRPAERGDN